MSSLDGLGKATLNSNTASSNSSASNSNSPAAAVDTVAKAASAALSDVAAAGEEQTETVQISSRAQKIQKLNEEFFAEGPRAIKITKALIERLAEYGLISQQEAESLGAGVLNKDQDESSAVAQLSNFIDSYAASLEQQGAEQGIIDSLRQAQTVLDHFNMPTASSRNIEIAQVLEQLQSHMDEVGATLPQKDQQSFSQLLLALGVANVLTPGVNSTAQIDKYLAVAVL
ncbi:hypothetical protein NO559_01515 [Dasania sp. GY-MA-18]|uniref:Uncharacterized protein n=1 Tax=Dasania phycosphaerae TaxID=2950436 RepID=A0A9J6RHP3_9GAMM|nr:MULTISPECIES: hypothetical protein [Dasania]MCR8921429.1 hypothetical protein [Dasania sp. GY-MA-18]MCZ0863857.1 hypothetical protein [Dasania phycosphaerae]MCZ0867585.1 hypothetical protein [Dasania phycosphaerae]